MRGRRKTPVALQIAAGDPRKHGVHKLEAALAAEPKASRGLPDCPRHLTTKAKKEDVSPLTAGAAALKQQIADKVKAGLPAQKETVALNAIERQRAELGALGIARAAWKFWAEELVTMDLDRRPDAQMLEGACVAYEQAVSCYLTLAHGGLVCEQVTRDPQTKETMVKLKPHPAVAIQHAAWNQVRSFCGLFGFSPVDRMRLAIESPADDSLDLAEMLSAPREKRDLPLFTESIN